MAEEQDQRQARLDQYAERFAQTSEALEAMTVDLSVYRELGPLLRKLKAYEKELTDEKREALAPAKAVVGRLTEEYAPALEAVTAALDAAKERVLSFLVAHDRARRAATSAGQQPPAPPPALEGVSVRESWTFEVTAPDLVPHELLTVDVQALKQRLKDAGDDEPEPVPGVKFERRKILAVRA